LIQRKRGLALVAVLAAIVTLLAMFPARVAYQMLSPPHLALSGFSGTIWRGGARELSTNGVYLRNVQWRLSVAGLLTGKAMLVVSGSPPTGFFDSEVALGLGGSVTLTGLNASMPLQMLESASGVPGLRGTMSLQLERLELIAGRAVALEGSIAVADLVVPMLARSPLGGYRADFFTRDDGIVASVEDTDGVVDLAGSLQLRPDKGYSFLGQIVAKPNTPDSLRQQIAYLPKTGRPGQHELRLDGSY
jgi:hypothetical protein